MGTVLANRLRNSGALLDSWVIVLVLGLVAAYAVVRLALRHRAAVTQRSLPVSPAVEGCNVRVDSRRRLGESA